MTARAAMQDRRRRYERTAEVLRREIESGRFKDQDLLPGERDLAGQFGVSRTTLRQALAELISAGLLAQRQGMGTFITHPAAEVPPAPRETSVTGPPRTPPHALVGPDAQVIEFERGLRAPTGEEALAFGLGPGEDVCRVLRLVLGGGVPSGIERTSVPTRLLPALHRETTPPADALASRGLVPVRTVSRLRGAVFTPDEARRLGITPDTPALQCDAAEFLRDGRCCLVVRGVYRLGAVDAVFQAERPAA